MIDERIAWTLAACARILRPVVRLALGMGVKHLDLAQLLRDLLLDEARRSWRERGVEPNISQLSVTTGLNRKAVTASVRADPDLLPHTDDSPASRTVTAWLELVAAEPERRTLPIAGAREPLTFESLANRASRGNVHHRSLLDELVRLRMVQVLDGQVTLAVAEFVPVDDLSSLLAFLGDNARDHLLAGVSNTLGTAAPMLERSVYASGLTPQDCDAIEDLVRTRWSTLHHELVGDLTRAVDAAQGEGTARVRIGIYVYHEDGATAPPAPG
ncbi:MAG: DUF6502 family protein [Variovorax sp.]